MTTKKQETKKTAGRTIDEFRASHDRSFIVPNKIRAGLQALGDGWAYEGDFVKLAGISLTDLGAYRGKFEEFVVTLKGSVHNGRKAWAGTKATAAKMREMLQ